MSNNGKFMTQFYIILVTATIALSLYYMYQNSPKKHEFESISAKRKEIDERYCQGPCQFINLVHVPEQGKYILKKKRT
jgi:Tfp pilus assembly protein PilO